MEGWAPTEPTHAQSYRWLNPFSGWYGVPVEHFWLEFLFFLLFLRLPVRAALLVPPVGCMGPGQYHGGNGSFRAARWGKFPSGELGGTPVQEDFTDNGVLLCTGGMKST